MVDQQHFNILQQNIGVWNRWRKEHPEMHPNLREANLSGANLSRVNLSRADLSGADLIETNLSGADLSRAFLYGADLSGADLSRVNLSGATLIGANLRQANLIEVVLRKADLSGADLSGVDLIGADLSRADLSGAILIETDLSRAVLFGATLIETDLSRANLSGAVLDKATLVETNLQGAILTDCSIYGISAWNIHLEKAKQQNLIITPPDAATITVDDLEVAQFLYLLLNNQKIRSVIDTITSKVVLLLGKFTPERKIVLETLRETLRQHNYLPIFLDFEKPRNRDGTETVSTLAHLAHFIIADLTDPSSIPQELTTIIPQCIVPVQPLLLGDEERQEYSLFHDLSQRYHWVLPIYRYTDVPSLLTSLQNNVITPAEKKAKELKLKSRTPSLSGKRTGWFRNRKKNEISH